MGKSEDSFSVLVVDENKKRSSGLKSILRYNQYYIEFASHGEQALKFIEEENKFFNVILIAIDNQTMAGHEALSLIKCIQSTKKSFFLVYGPKSFEYEYQYCKELGVKDFIHDTSNYADFVNVIKKFQKMGEPEAPNADNGSSNAFLSPDDIDKFKKM